ncbi:MAG: LacI family DNA-binding transcriptional regulator [Phycisphaerae bacterium]|jgi:DNA-binding LacI/PurR family transcriptional regulator
MKNNESNVVEMFPLQHTTSFEVAKLAGVNRSTVSRVINQPNQVNRETRRKVEAAMKRLNYHPWSGAKFLAKRRSGIVGFITDTPKDSDVFATTNGILEKLTNLDYMYTMSTILPDATLEQLKELPMIRQHSCDGLIFELTFNHGNMTEFCAKLPIPYVLINAENPLLENCIIYNDRNAAKMAVDYLISKGHRRIAYMTGGRGGNPHISIVQREQGYEIAMLRAGLKPVPDFNVHLPAKTESDEIYDRPFIERTERWLSGPEPVTAILTYSSLLAVRLARMAYDKKMFIPEQFSLMSCDDNSNYKEMLPLTSMAFDRKRIGCIAAEMLLGKNTADPQAKWPSIYIEPELIERGTVKDIRSSF